jgi:23S rRNA pseudouridine1911/1915/1917 synthase
MPWHVPTVGNKNVGTRHGVYLRIKTYFCKKFQVKTTVARSCTLMEFLEEQYKDSPRTRIKKMLQGGSIAVNGKPATRHSILLKPGDVVEISRSTSSVNRSGAPFTILYDDHEVIVVDKPAGISTSSVDGSRNVRDELSAFLRDRTKGKVRAWVVHRLDKEVSGVLLFAKSETLADRIRENWDETEKHYYALTEGTPEKPEGTIKSYLKEDDRQKVFSTTDERGSKLAVTDYRFVKKAGEYTLLDVTTKTGRKNQIRVHLSDIGCPIAGDRKYGASAEFERRVRLHAYALSFPHPATGRIITVRSQMPAGFMSVKNADEKYK